MEITCYQERTLSLLVFFDKTKLNTLNLNKVFSKGLKFIFCRHLKKLEKSSLKMYLNQTKIDLITQIINRLTPNLHK